MSTPFLLIHIGAGKHLETNDQEYKQVIKRALSKNDVDGIDSIKSASMILDEHKLVNSGFGSSPNMIGKISNDASILQYDHSQLIAYKCLHNINHNQPIREVIRVFNCIDKLFEIKQLNKIGLVKPRILDYSTRNYLYPEVGIEIPGDAEVLENQQNQFQLYSKALDLMKDEVQDTIGMIHICGATSLAASSGGNFLKLPGRVGCAGVVGAGTAFKVSGEIEISCLCSGNGEDIILLQLANLMIDNWEIPPHEIDPMIRGKWQDIAKFSERLYIGAVLVVHNTTSGCINVIYYHTTETFYFGYNFKGTKIIQSKLNGNYIVGEFQVK